MPHHYAKSEPAYPLEGENTRSRGANAHAHPRSELVKALLTSLRREKHGKNKREYADRGVGSLLDGHCTTEELMSISRYYMNLNTGESARNLELPNLFSIPLEHEGYTDCRALVMIMEQGKTNQFGRREFGSCRRHCKVEICPVGALAFYFFFRWSIEKEDIPNFLVPERWYDIKLLKSGTDLLTPLHTVPTTIRVSW
ncbi:Hypothetical protein PHPALM_4427 [Phytophthora palmivora]|uniref:Ndc10 domain-containing protein n=1 Tax=Phytophthora palmivora TaxID=4796 RepID=A0A2P4YJV7_9STRA|nr:Hypothetical protein PHPALM_4427 [Phytophthora palmivora]